MAVETCSTERSKGPNVLRVHSFKRSQGSGFSNQSINTTTMQLSTLFCLFLVSIASALPSPFPTDTALIYDSKITNLESYTSLLNYLREELRVPLQVLEFNSPELEIFKNGQRNFDNLIIFPTKARSIGSESNIHGLDLLNFFNDGGNVFTITSPTGVSETVRNYLNQIGIYPSPRNHELVDYFVGSNETSFKSIKLTAENVKLESNIISSVPEITYSGSAALLTNNNLLFPILQSPSTSFTKNSQESDEANNWTVGTQGYLAVGHQGLNNARGAWIGDASLLDDSQFSTFDKELLQWTFQMKNILRVTEVKHNHINGDTYAERPYKVKDELEYQITLQEFNGEQWSPVSFSDLQFEIKLISPYHRLNLSELSQDENSTTYGVTFKVPDRHGVYTLQTIYQRPGWSFVEEKEVLSIRHLANDEYPRSWDIPNSWVYITSSVVVFAAWIVFLIVFIYIKDGKIVDSKKQK
ncbi:hypothetical protein WICPIJ_005554 [Wickerhamomyces pijperi]|uniref:Dolichyl-diphosphooligosaccharide--protein glycosyltransferase subunit WBP1 n=1 Tax=Wickerhamomyces pijperi TaxID=599730 RepID=A0A9P8Q5R4_WICPI|nr:hypothetical protein WICPIJ_005554 [Wickerhamomyces pijperi]